MIDDKGMGEILLANLFLEFSDFFLCLAEPHFDTSLLSVQTTDFMLVIINLDMNNITDCV